jgi:molybdopterin biosynthesis enzyme
VTPLANQDSAAVATLSMANALIVRAAGSPAAAVGESVDILRIA